MLRRLFIRDFVIVDRLELDFGAGFGALTGETGAGKSILVDALALALGERADAAVVRVDCERAEIGAEFDVPPGGALEAWLRANDFDADDSCLLRRLVDAGGRSRATINGSPATLGQLREAAAMLADIHGQHAYHALLRPEAQRRLLDERAGANELAAETATAYRNWKNLHEARELAERDSQSAARERETLEWQVGELRNLDFTAESWATDNLEQRRLGHAAKLLAGTGAALAVLDDSEHAVAAQIEQVLAGLRSLAELDSTLDECVRLLDEAHIEVREAANALARYRDRLELEPDRLNELEARIAAVTALARKHRVSPDDLPAVLAALSARLDELALASDPVALAAREQDALASYRHAAGRLTAARRRAAGELSAAVSAGMQQLAMTGGRFAVELEALAAPSAGGAEEVGFMVAANAGQPLRPLAKAASGGELSRIGLAIQVIASCAGDAPTVIFDEVDVGIGGRVAEIVGRMLKQLGERRQVLCVTHLAQVAACADWQWSVAKQSRDGRALSTVTMLDDAGRIEELARMLGGVRITDTTRRHAREMLGLR